MSLMGDPLAVTDGTLKKRKSPAEYQREYRARKKAKKYNISTTSSPSPEECTASDSLTRSNPSTTAGSSTSNLVCSTNSIRRKSAAEYQREYRARKNAERESIRAALSAITNDSSTENMQLNGDKSVSANRNAFSVTPVCGLTIFKSQGGTFDEVIYYQEKIQDQQLVYVATSRIVSLEDLFIIPLNKQEKFRHEKGSKVPSPVDLRNEVIQLRENPFFTLDEQLYEFINSRRNLSIVSFNCHSLHVHANGVTDRVFHNSNILMLSETVGSNDECPVSMPKFDFIVKFKRNDTRNSGVTVDHHRDDGCYITTPHLEIKTPQSSNSGPTISTSTEIGDLCGVECRFISTANDPRKLMLIAIYISPDAVIRDITSFIGKSLLPLCGIGSQALADIIEEEADYCQWPVILAGDFNVNFSLAESEPLLTFLKEKFSLEMINGRNDPTTERGTTIDAVFVKNIDKIELEHFVCYFSYHNPLVNISDRENDVSIKQEVCDFQD
ncbi:uncharacterized protein LOC135160564 isoform X4 [Diachasmimorpha longicaudata]